MDMLFSPYMSKLNYSSEQIALSELLFNKVLDCLEKDNVCYYSELIDRLCYVVIRKEEISIYNVDSIHVVDYIKRCILDRNWHILNANIYRMIIEDNVYIYKKIKFDKETITLIGFILQKTPEVEMELIRKQSEYIQKSIKTNE